MSAPADLLLPDGEDVPFARLPDALAHNHAQSGSGPQARALWATVVAVGPDSRLNEAAGALRALGGSATVRGILISVGREPRPVPRMAGDIVGLSGLEPAFVNNAVAALRLSSLPTILWWRGGRPEILPEVVQLADRVVLDGDPLEVWPHAVPLFEAAAFSDLRWTRLTRWRTLMAHFFDIPEVRQAAPSFTSLRITGADRVAAALFAGWIGGSSGRTGALDFEFAQGSRGAFIDEVRLGDHEQELRLRLNARGTCVLTSAIVREHRGAARAVTLGDQSLAALMTEELRVRARDRAFEAAVHAFLGRS